MIEHSNSDLESILSDHILNYRVFGNEGYKESGSKLIDFGPNHAPNAFIAFTINIRFHL